MRTVRALSLPGLLALLALLSACGSSSAPVAGSGASSSSAPTGSASSSIGGSSTCLTSSLSLHLGNRGGAAGSVYQPIVFTNTGSGTCTLLGYPGVAFVTQDTGHQVGAAASRNPQHAPTTVTLAAGASASALLQIVNAANYPAARCHPTTVAGLRVYPPGSTRAAYLPFDSATTACTTQVNQLTVEAVVSGSSGS